MISDMNNTCLKEVRLVKIADKNKKILEGL
jgi:hypothetical protein